MERHMNKTKLFDHQLNAVKMRLNYSYEQVKDAILDKYNAYALEDLNATDFDEILEDIQEWTHEITSDLVG